MANEDNASTSELGSERGGTQTGLPAKINIEDCLKAIRVLGDKGGTASAPDLEEAFGGKKVREQLSRSLSTMSRLHIIEKKGETYLLGKRGGEFLAFSDDQKKDALAKELIAYRPYRDVYVRLKNAADKSMSKADLTNMWVSIAGGKLKIRRAYTTAFGSLVGWSGIVAVEGNTIMINQLGIDLLEGKGVQHAAAPSTPQPPTTYTPPVVPAAQPPAVTRSSGLSCPICDSTSVGLKGQDIVQTITTKAGTTLFVRNIYYCQNCKQEFSRLTNQVYT